MLSDSSTQVPQASRAADTPSGFRTSGSRNCLHTGSRRAQTLVPSLPGWVTSRKALTLLGCFLLSGAVVGPRALGPHPAGLPVRLPLLLTHHGGSMLGGPWALCHLRRSSLLGRGPWCLSSGSPHCPLPATQPAGPQPRTKRHVLPVGFVREVAWCQPR